MIDEGEEMFWEDTWQSVDSALHIFDSAGIVSEHYFGRADTTYLNARNWLARCYYWRDDIDIADSLISGSLSICEGFLGADHPITAFNSACSAFLVWIRGREGDAIPACLRAIEILENAPGYRDRYYEALNILQLIYSNQQRWAEYDSLYPVVLDVCTEVYGPDSRQCAWLYEVRGMADWTQNKSADAEAMALKAIDILERIGGTRQASRGYTILARVNQQNREYHKAETVLREQLRLAEQQWGPTNWYVVESTRDLLDVLCQTASSRKDWEEIEKLAARAQRMCSSAWFVRLGSLQDALCAAYGINGKYDRCLEAFDETIEARLRFTDNSFLYASEHEKLRASTLHPTVLSPFISFVELHSTGEARRDALAMILKGRARILDAVAAERQFAFCSDDETLIGLTTAYANVSSQISNLFTASGNRAYNKKLDDSLTVLYKAMNRLETEMSERCAEFRREMERRSVTVSDVANALPERSVLLEYIEYYPYKFEPVPYFDNYGAPVYGVFVLDASSSISFVRLGEARVIDSLVSECRDNIEEASRRVYDGGEAAAAKELSIVTNELYNLVFAPVEESIGDSNQLFICPDKELNLIPFEILSMPDGKYMIEKYSISYLSSGRDLLNYKDTITSFGGDAIVIADPNYDNDLIPELTDPFAYIERDTLSVQTRGPADHSECLADLFMPIPATALEGQRVTQILSRNVNGTVKAYYHERAAERVLKEIDVSPRVLHIATHGYFCPKSSFSDTGELTENPLLYSGLALAGANRTVARESNDSGDMNTDDGILTALEVSGLNLSETGLVVLSSCNSGIGRLRDDPEGIYGLRRAFQLAGARSVIMSLMPVPDQATEDLMDRYYTNWLTGSKKSVALRQAALKMLDERRHKYGVAHPLFWAGFILLGDPN